MKRVLVLSAILLNFIIALHAFSSLRNPFTTVHADEVNSPYIESCDSTGTIANSFTTSDQIYIIGNGLEPGGVYYIYIVKDYPSWTLSHTHISDPYILEGPITVDIDTEGNIENQPFLIWESPIVGDYDIWADCQTNGEIGFYDECDAIDSIDVEGFSVIPEIILITILLVFACLLVIFVKRRNTVNK